MKRSGYLCVFALVGLSLSGCITPYGRPDYTASGALAGGATGAIVGSMSHNAGAGALVGAVVGGLMGHGMDQEQEARLRAQAPQTMQRVEESQPLRVSDVKALSQAGISEDLIISQIRNSRTVYHLSTADIIGLKNSGVSEEVIDFMINTPTQIQSSEVAVVGNLPPEPLYETIVVPPGPDYIWVGGSWVWYGDNWLWNRGYWHRPKSTHSHRGRGRH